MTLEELQAEFPHGSRWITNNSEVRVVGHDPASNWAVVVRQGDRPVEAYQMYYARTWKRIPDPGPCPITEPTTLTRPGSYWTSQPIRQGRQLIILHPAEPGATEGRYTWDGTP